MNRRESKGERKSIDATNTNGRRAQGHRVSFQLPSFPQRKRITTALSVNVQTRRSHTRTLLETRQRKAALLALDPEEVVHRLQVMRPSEGLLDSRQAAETANAPQGRGKRPSKTGVHVVGEGEEPKITPPPKTFRQWVKSGFPTTSWRALLLDELYHPIEAEKQCLALKYTVCTKPTESEKGSQ
uniref:Uncharacterized protein TCIL3000_3_2310 n=1 Tax=Trypanosoma congolense (strain IL3000) TaxID=1068625 RepID=G0UK94_TRYCI|nr:unnamed protein product [Trypanosoma congolense IL3000]